MSNFVQLIGSLYPNGARIVKAAIGKNGSGWSLDTFINYHGCGDAEDEFIAIVTYHGLVMGKFINKNHASAFSQAWAWMKKLDDAERDGNIAALQILLGTIKYDLFIEAKGLINGGN